MYILECSDLSFYVGSTVNLEWRIAQHQAGLGAKYTKRRVPVRFVYGEEYESIEEAFLREKQVQNWGRAKRIALIEGRFSDLNALSHKPPRRVRRADGE